MVGGKYESGPLSLTKIPRVVPLPLDSNDRSRRSAYWKNDTRRALAVLARFRPGRVIGHSLRRISSWKFETTDTPRRDASGKEYFSI